MIRRSILAFLGFVVVSSLLLTAGAGARVALVTEPLLDPVYAPEVGNFLSPDVPVPAATTVTNPVTSTAITSSDVALGEGFAETGAAELGSLPLVQMVVGGVIAGYVGWKIGTADYKAVSDLFSTPSVPGGITTVGWACETGVTAPTMPAPFATTCGSSTSSTGFCLGAGVSCVDGGHGGYILLINGSGSFCYVIATGAGCNAVSAYAVQFQGAGNLVTYTAGASSCGNTAGTQGCFWVWRSPQQYGANVSITNSTSSAYSSAPAKVDATGLQPTPVSTSSTQFQQALQNMCAYKAITSCTASQAAVRCSIDVALVPGYDCATATGSPSSTGTSVATNASTFELPEPTLDETYSTYIERLRALGYLGDVTVLDQTMSGFPSGSYAARLAPQSLTGVQVGTATSIDLYDAVTGARNTWPTSATSLVVTPGTTTSITLHRVPDGYDPLAHGATTATETGAGAAPGSAGSCNCPPIDFTPIESLSYSSKIPFAFFTWAAGLFPTAGSGTAFSIPVTNPTTGFSVQVGDHSSEWETTYRPVIFPILEFIISIGAIWFICVRIIGLGGNE